MGEKSKGYISLWRSLQDNFLWEDKPFAKGQAWIDLLLMANHKPTKIMIGNDVEELKQGEFITSIAKLCKRWGWSNTKVKSFLNLLEKDGMLITESTTKRTKVSLRNYSDYQVSPLAKNDTKTIQKRYENDTKTIRSTCENDTFHLQKHTNNNDNNLNNDNNDNNDNKQTIVSQSFLAIKDVYENNIGLLNGATMEELIKWQEEGMEVELICEAIKIANLKNKRSMSFVRGILNNWANDGTYTLTDYKAKEQERKNNLSTTKKEEDSNGEAKDDEPFGTFEKMYGRDYGRFVKEGELDNLPF